MIDNQMEKEDIARYEKDEKEDKGLRAKPEANLPSNESEDENLGESELSQVSGGMTKAELIDKIAKATNPPRPR